MKVLKRKEVAMKIMSLGALGEEVKIPDGWEREGAPLIANGPESFTVIQLFLKREEEEDK